MDLDLHNVHTLITGSAGGIGLATVKQFLTHGALVSAHYRSTRASLETDEQCAEAIKGGRLVCVRGDVTKEEDVRGFFGEAERAMGRPVGVLVGEFGFSSEECGRIAISRI